MMSGRLPGQALNKRANAEDEFFRSTPVPHNKFLPVVRHTGGAAAGGFGRQHSGTRKPSAASSSVLTPVDAALELSHSRLLEELAMQDFVADDGIQLAPDEVHAYLQRVLYNRRNKCVPPQRPQSRASTSSLYASAMDDQAQNRVPVPALAAGHGAGEGSETGGGTDSRSLLRQVRPAVELAGGGRRERRRDPLPGHRRNDRHRVHRHPRRHRWLHGHVTRSCKSVAVCSLCNPASAVHVSVPDCDVDGWSCMLRRGCCAAKSPCARWPVVGLK